MGEINTRTVVMVVIVFLSMVFSLHGESFIRWRKEWVGIYRSTDLQSQCAARTLNRTLFTLLRVALCTRVPDLSTSNPESNQSVRPFYTSGHRRHYR